MILPGSIGTRMTRFAVCFSVVILSCTAFGQLPGSSSAATPAPIPPDFNLQVSPPPLVVTVKPGTKTTTELKIHTSGSGTEDLQIQPRSFKYDSKTGNVERFIEKIRSETNWHCLKISNIISAEQEGHLVTYTTKIGSVPDTTLQFMEKYSHLILSVSSSGNMNWGANFALAADKIAEKCTIPVLTKFELSGLERDVNSFIQKVKEYANKKMDTPQ